MLDYKFCEKGVMTRRYQANSKLIPAIEKLIVDKCRNSKTFFVKTEIEDGFEVKYYKENSIYKSVDEAELILKEIFYIRDNSRPSYDLYIQLEYQLYEENKK
ncbi:MAG: hypothetical protein ACRC23_02015 [Aeromonas jandaei]